ncbi:MAG: type I 3-dehydroquinate dehydratase [Verrucomicrobiota bacterium]
MFSIESAGNVVATITTKADLGILADNPLPEGIDVAEFRLDNLIEDVDQAEEVAKSCELPILITARNPREGGVNDLPEGERLKVLLRFLPLAKLVDLEIQTLESSKPARNLLREAQQSGVLVLGSFHDFDQTPPISTLRETLLKGADLGVDAPKLALFLDSMENLFALSELVQKSLFPVSAMGMGPLGKLSRLVLAKAGSALNYGYFREPNAPGQWSAETLKGLITEL